MGRANLRQLGLTDDRIDTMTTRQAQATIIAHEALAEQRLAMQREQEWLTKAADGGPVIPVRTMSETSNRVGEDDG